MSAPAWHRAYLDRLDAELAALATETRKTVSTYPRTYVTTSRREYGPTWIRAYVLTGPGVRRPVTLARRRSR
jgi:hypothetical protein